MSDLGTGQGPSNRRLQGWKEIAAALGKDESTVKRWAASRGLPVRRVPGRNRASVYASSNEIDAWLAGHDDGAPTANAEASRAVLASPPAPVAAGPGLSRRSYWMALGLTLAAGAAGAAALSTMIAAPYPAGPSAPYRPSQDVAELYADATYLWERRTPDTLRRAMLKLEQAVELDPRFAPAHSALATVANLAVEYGIVPAAEGYDRAKRAAGTALSLDPRQAQAHAVLGDIVFFRDRAFADGLRHFEAALTIDPDHGQARHWYAAALMCFGRYRDALFQIEAAQRLEPTSRSVRVSKGMVLLAAGHAEAAARTFRQLLDTEPDYRSPLRFLAFTALAREEFAGHLDAWNRRFQLTGDAGGEASIRAGAIAYRETGDIQAAATAMREAADTSGAAVPLDRYFVAHVHALAGDWRSAARTLGEIETRHAFYYAIDPAFIAARREPEFRREIASLRLPVLR